MSEIRDIFKINNGRPPNFDFKIEAKEAEKSSRLSPINGTQLQPCRS
jgi:hypothetical protein